VLRAEIDLEREIRKIVRDYSKEVLNLDEKMLTDVIFSHGENDKEKDLWTMSKSFQNIIVYGVKKSSDIFIKHPDLGTIYIEIKYAKKRGKSASTLPGDLQRAIGQSIIASLKHSFVICLIICETELMNIPYDLGGDLKVELWNEHRIALIVRALSVSGPDEQAMEKRVREDFEQLHDQIKSVEKEYNPKSENLHFSQLVKADNALFYELLKLAQSGLDKVRLHHDFFIWGRLYDDGMFWYELCLLISSSAMTAKIQKSSISKRVIKEIVKILVDISQYATATGGDMWKRNHEALGNTLIAFNDDDLIKAAIDQGDLVGLCRVKDFVRDSIKLTQGKNLPNQ
jgi:hypothetical protein